MIKDKISSQEIIDLVASKASVSKRAAEEFLRVMISSIEEALLAGETVKVKNFGTFKLQWNEPRKSVNVQTGNDIILAGYYKVSFTPDVILKEIVNEPFAHLEPIELDSETNDPKLDNSVEAIDPLRIFTEQASEIKSLILEIQALSSTPNLVVQNENIKYEVVENKVDPSFNQIKDNEPEHIAEEKIEQDYVSNVTEDEAENSIQIKLIEEPIAVDEKESDSISKSFDFDIESTPFLGNIKIRKSRVWLWILIIVLLLAGSGFGAYYFYPPARDFTNNSVTGIKSSFNKTRENFSITEMSNTISKWISPSPKPPVSKVEAVVPKVTNKVSALPKKSIDSLQLMFDNPRVYKTFIATERIQPGSRLTLISKRYFKSKDFWVYIYEANKDRIPNPDNIAKGTLIQIPKLDSRLIDVNNPRCLKKAKDLHDLYVKK
ncbi:MAG: HU family DNA-binding protein [Paludibacter sp.]|nr:HU family DNA-binding protein [Paludibacter sp.]